MEKSVHYSPASRDAFKELFMDVDFMHEDVKHFIIGICRFSFSYVFCYLLIVNDSAFILRFIFDLSRGFISYVIENKNIC